MSPMKEIEKDRYRLDQTVRSLLKRFIFTARSVLDMDTRVAAVLVGLHAQSHLPPSSTNFIFGVIGAAVYALLKCWPKSVKRREVRQTLVTVGPVSGVFKTVQR